MRLLLIVEPPIPDCGYGRREGDCEGWGTSAGGNLDSAAAGGHEGPTGCHGNHASGRWASAHRVFDLAAADGLIAGQEEQAKCRGDDLECQRFM